VFDDPLALLTPMTTDCAAGEIQAGPRSAWREASDGTFKVTRAEPFAAGPAAVAFVSDGNARPPPPPQAASAATPPTRLKHKIAQRPPITSGPLRRDDSPRA
jgi:hypothetical protein